MTSMGRSGDRTNPWYAALEQSAETCSGLLRILWRYCGEHGDNEGAIETLRRILRERDAAEAYLRENNLLTTVFPERDAT